MKTERSESDSDAEIRLRSRGRIALDELLRDVRQAFRLMRRKPGFTAIVTLTLAVAIGANTALFSVVDGVLLQVLPYREPQRLVQVHATHPQTAEAPLTAAEFYEYREQNRIFENMALLSFFEHEYYGPAGPEQLPGYDVSHGYFEMLGFTPLLGRSFTPEDEQSGGEARVIISHRFWQSRLGGDQNVIGKTVNLSRHPFLIIGVAPPDLKHVSDAMVAHGDSVDFWLPIRLQRGQLSRTRRIYEVVGRLKQGVTLEEARTDLNRIAAGLERDYPASNACGARSLAVMVLMAAILLAALIPDRRGAKIDPASMLKSE